MTWHGSVLEHEPRKLHVLRREAECFDVLRGALWVLRLAHLLLLDRLLRNPDRTLLSQLCLNLLQVIGILEVRLLGKKVVHLSVLFVQELIQILIFLQLGYKECQSTLAWSTKCLFWRNHPFDWVQVEFWLPHLLHSSSDAVEVFLVDTSMLIILFHVKIVVTLFVLAYGARVCRFPGLLLLLDIFFKLWQKHFLLFIFFGFYAIFLNLGNRLLLLDDVV